MATCDLLIRISHFSLGTTQQQQQQQQAPQCNTAAKRKQQAAAKSPRPSSETKRRQCRIFLRLCSHIQLQGRLPCRLGCQLNGIRFRRCGAGAELGDSRGAGFAKHSQALACVMSSHFHILCNQRCTSFSSLYMLSCSMCVVGAFCSLIARLSTGKTRCLWSAFALYKQFSISHSQNACCMFFRIFSFCASG